VHGHKSRQESATTGSDRIQPAHMPPGKAGGKRHSLHRGFHAPTAGSSGGTKRVSHSRRRDKGEVFDAPPPPDRRTIMEGADGGTTPENLRARLFVGRAMRCRTPSSISARLIRGTDLTLSRIGRGNNGSLSEPMLCGPVPNDREPDRGVLGRSRLRSDAIGEEIAAVGVEAVIPAKVNRRTPAPHDRAKCRWRNLIERLFNKLKNWRRIATPLRQKPRSAISASSFSLNQAMDTLCPRSLIFGTMAFNPLDIASDAKHRTTPAE